MKTMLSGFGGGTCHYRGSGHGYCRITGDGYGFGEEDNYGTDDGNGGGGGYGFGYGDVDVDGDGDGTGDVFGGGFDFFSSSSNVVYKHIEFVVA